MKFIKDMQVTDSGDKIIINKKYFCLFDKDCYLGYTIQHEEIEKCCYPSEQNDKFIAPNNMKSDEDTSFIAPVKFKKDSDVSENSKIESQILVLFVKAESDNSIMPTLKTNMKLLPKYSDDLYIQTMNLWVGSKIEFEKYFASDFIAKENIGSIPKLDFVLIHLELQGIFEGYKKNVPSFERIEFFKLICEKELPIIQISNRMCFENSKGAMQSWEK